MRRPVAFFIVGAGAAGIAFVASCTSDEPVASGVADAASGAPPEAAASTGEPGRDANDGRPDPARDVDAGTDSGGNDAGGNDSGGNDSGANDSGADAAVSCAGPRASNLLVNPGFDINAAGWSVEALALRATLDARDGAGCLTSKSIALTSAPGGVNAALSQCVAVTAGTSYAFGGRAFMPPSAFPGNLYFLVDWHASPGCGGNPSDTTLSIVPSTRDTWLDNTMTVNAPVGAVSARVRLKLITTSESFVGLFDRVFFGLSPGGF